MSMKNKTAKLILAFWVMGIFGVQAQKFKKLPEANLEVSSVEKHIRFLASDELMGRKTGHAGNNSAARYIAEEFRSYGLTSVNNGSYFQEIPFVNNFQPAGSKIEGGAEVLKVNEDYLVMNGSGIHLKDVEKVHIGYAWISKDGSYDDYKDVDVRGKIVVAQIGTPESSGFLEMFGASKRKEEIAKERGALALIEIFTSPAPWAALVRNFGDGSISLKDSKSTDLPRFLMSAKAGKLIGKEVIGKISVDSDALKQEMAYSNNVVGFVEGTDPNLRDEYVVMTAHFDHIGFRENHEEGEDYIFNGARDNAIGVAGLLSAAKSIGANPAKRSMLFIAYTGEEIGLRGSNYYARNPLLPLNKCIFNLNIDGAGYNDKTKISGIGIARTGAETEITKAVQAVGLILIDEPSLEQGLFDRSDNLSLASKGIPAPSFSPGFTAFDEEIMKYYHKEADEADNLDFAYCTKFSQSYAYAGRLIANMKLAPKWIVGDKYEAASKELYGNN
jgi:hypothetical protein